MQLQLAAESHVPCFQERVGTSQPRYMIAVRLPWRPRARPSATLHEIQVHPRGWTCSAYSTKTAMGVKGLDHSTLGHGQTQLPACNAVQEAAESRCTICCASSEF